jgi:hypothetical protein
MRKGGYGLPFHMGRTQVIQTLMVSVPKAKDPKAPNRRGLNSHGKNSNMLSVRFGQYEYQLLTRVSKELDIPLAEFIREAALRCSKALIYGTPSSDPGTRAYLDGHRNPAFPDDG